jgi:hypothetical protein
LTIPAGDLPTDLPIVISVFAYNNGAFNSLAASGSTMNIRGEAFVGYPTITVAEPYHIMGQDMSFKFEHVYVYRGTTQIDNATVSVNGTPAPVGADKYHAVTRQRAVGNPLQLQSPSGSTIAGVGNVPETPGDYPRPGLAGVAHGPAAVTCWAARRSRSVQIRGWSRGPNCGTGKAFRRRAAHAFTSPADLPSAPTSGQWGVQRRQLSAPLIRHRRCIRVEALAVRSIPW